MITITKVESNSVVIGLPQSIMVYDEELGSYEPAPSVEPGIYETDGEATAIGQLWHDSLLIEVDEEGIVGIMEGDFTLYSRTKQPRTSLWEIPPQFRVRPQEALNIFSEMLEGSDYDLHQEFKKAVLPLFRNNPIEDDIRKALGV